MRNHFFDPVFLFDFYSDMGFTATPSAFLIRAGPDLENFEQNRQSPVFAFLSNI